MAVSPILKPLTGEHVIAVSPSFSPQVDDWNRRLHLFKGRSLSDIALTVEQNGRAGRLATSGQVVSAGVVDGLEVGLDAQDPTKLHVAAGFGVCATGEDVVVPKPLVVKIADISVYAPSYLLGPLQEPPPETPLTPPEIQAGELYPREVGPSLAALKSKNVTLPAVGILVLQPVVVDTLGRFDSTDPCEQDATNDAFDDEQLIDGCRLLFYAWPTEYLDIPAVGDSWRNLLAYSIFSRELLLDTDELLPWEQIGVPIGLIAFDNGGSALFVDRFSVVREGGRPKSRSSSLTGVGNEFLWQARIQQLAEQLSNSKVASLAPADQAKLLRFLPPAGILPISTIQLRSGSGNSSRIGTDLFFPSNYTVDAVPVPIEQLDFMIGGCAALGPFDVAVPDRLRLLVPVPQIWYEPDLLKVLAIDPLFQSTIDKLVSKRSFWLKRRADVRAIVAVLQKAISGTTQTFPDPDPNAIEPTETVATTETTTDFREFTSPEDSYNTDSSAGQLKSTDIETLKTKLSGILPQTTDATPVTAELDQLDALGLATFISYLQKKADFTDDRINFGFLQAQANIYKARQYMLGNDVGTRLATSPALTAIAQGQSAVATQQDLQTFYSNLKNPVSTTPTESTPSTGTPPTATRMSSLPELASTAFRAKISPAATIGAVVEKPTPNLSQVVAQAGISTAGVTVSRPSFTGILRTATTTDPSLFATVNTAATSVDVTQQVPIVGETVRTTSVVERLSSSPPRDTKSSSVASKLDVISTFATSTNVVAVKDIAIPGFLGDDGKETSMQFKNIDSNVLGDILNKKHDPDPTDSTEGSYFSAAVRAMDHTIETLRLIEGRVFAYRQAVQVCQNTLAAIQAISGKVNQRLTDIEKGIAESRQDLVVARGLMADEQARIAGINQQRDEIVTKQVKFLAYMRVRECEAIVDVPARLLDPDFTEAAIPSALTRDVTAPPELRAMVNLLRDAPIKWFQFLPRVFDYLDRIDTLHRSVLNTKLRAMFKLAQPADADPPTSSGPLKVPILETFSAQRTVMTQYRQAAAQLDLANFAGQTWQQSRDLAKEFVSAGDLIDLGAFQPEVPRISASELENIYKVASCLYADFSNVLPAIRLDWAQRLIQLQGAVNLRNLSSLPNWIQLSYIDRKELQAFVDWLFSRVNPSIPNAVAYMNDLVRVCLLLASHAPVTQVISGEVLQPTTVGVGGRVNLGVDLTKVRVGMHVLLYDANNSSVAHGVVENLASGQATARILAAKSTTVSISQNARAQFAEPDAFQRNPLTSTKLLLK